MRNKKSNFRGKVASDAQRQQKAATSYGHLLLPKDIKVFNPKPGSKVLLDFLPYEVTDAKHPDRNPEQDVAMPGSLWYKRPYKLHRNVGADNDSAVCPTSIKKPCPICEHRSVRSKAGADKEELKAMNASQRNLYVVVPLGEKDYDEKPHIMDIAQFLFQDLLNEELQENEDNEVFPDLEEGKSVKIRFDSTTIAGSKAFATADRIDFIERESQYKESILTKVPNLDEVLKIYSYEELSAKWFELESEPDGGKLRDVDDDNIETDRVKKTVNPDKEPARSTRRAVKEEKEKTKDLPTWAELKRIDRANLTTLIEEYELGLNIDDFEDSDAGDDELRKDIAVSLDIVIPKRSTRPTNKEPEEKEEKHTPTRGSVSSSTRTSTKDEADVVDKKSGSRASRGTDPEEKCPYNHTFGKDTERFDDCDNCKLFDDCLDAKRAANKK
jgi:hypothetical protein